MPALTVEQLLAGCTTGRLQSVGQMAVIPILGESVASQDETFGAPNLAAGTRNYGSVQVENRGDRPTIVPTNAAFVTPEAAQDHALSGGSLLKAKESKTIENAYCIQQTQGGLIPIAEREFTILPAALRAPALAHRTERQYNAMWTHIEVFRRTYGDHGVGNLVEFLKKFEKELDQFVAEFENLPNQIGALVLVAGKVVGIERTPNAAYWAKVWTPLIRVCYGSLALRVSRENRGVPETRLPLATKAMSIDALRDVLAAAKKASVRFVEKAVEAVSGKELAVAPDSQSMSKARLITVVNREYAGQVVFNSDRPIYTSLSLTG